MDVKGYLGKLLDGAEVEWLSVSQIFNIKNGYTPSKSKKEYWENGDIPWFRMDDIRENGRILGMSLQKISSCAVKGGKLFPENSILISTSATIGEHALITVPHLANQRFTCLSLKLSYVERFNIKFLFYYCFSLADWCRKNTTMSSFASVDMDGFRKFLVPIPCPNNPEKSLAIQSEIVRILDAFTELTNELTNELKLREKQYNYCRDKLLNFSGNSGGGYCQTRCAISNTGILQRLLDGAEVEWKTLDELGTFYGGLTGKSKDDFNHGNCVYASYKNIFSNLSLDTENLESVVIHDNEKQNTILWGDILFTGSSETPNEAGMSSVLTKKVNYPIYLNSFSFGYRFNDGLLFNPEFSKYLFRTNYLRQKISKTANGVTRFNISKKLMGKIQIPIPPLEVQQEIVRILDKFDTLTNSISEGLPREIELRRKQYEYYRDLLFRFPKPDKTELKERV